MQGKITIILKAGREESLLRFHPWLFSGAIDRIEGNPESGDTVRVVGSNGQPLGYGHYSTGSIAVKMLTFSDEIPAEKFFEQHITAAVELRRILGLIDSEKTTAFRLMHAEGDGLPGLIADLFGNALVIDFHSAGMLRERDRLIELFKVALGRQVQSIWCRIDDQLREDIPQEAEGLAWGENVTSVEILENGRKFIVDIAQGQKTGFFTDQRDNRALVASYGKGKKVLDCFCYSGAFASYLGTAGAASLTLVDSSKSALALAQQNLKRNLPACDVFAVCEDALPYLKNMTDVYDLIVLDPPAFVKHRGAIKGGIKGYETINYNAIEKIKAGGVLATFSCSQLVSRDAFRSVVFKAAQKSGRAVRVLHEMRQAPCHPVSLYHPEAEYLKGLLLYVE